LSASLGGGQYNIGEGPNTLIKDARNFDASTRISLRGGYFGNKSGSERVKGGKVIDHIIPLALGGTNDLTNIHLIDNGTDELKTPIDTLAVFLYQKGKISLGVARNTSKNWNNNPGSLLPLDDLLQDFSLNKPIVFNEGTSKETTLNLHEMVQKLRDGNYSKVNASIDPMQLPTADTRVTAKGVLGEIPGAITKALSYFPNLGFKALKAAPKLANQFIGAPLYGLGAGLFKGENVGKATKEYFDKAERGDMPIKNPAENPFLEAAPALIRGLSFNQIQPETGNTYTDPTDKIVANLASTIGQGLGAGISISKLGVFLPSLASKIPYLGPLGTSVMGKLSTSIGSTTLAKAIAASPTASKLAKGMLTSYIGMAGYSQLSNSPERSSEIAENLQQRAKQFLTDIGMATVFTLGGSLISTKFPTVGVEGVPNFKRILGVPILPQTTAAANMIKGTLASASAGYAITYMETGDRNAALTNAATFAALHGYGLAETHVINPEAARAQATATKNAIDYFKYFGIENVNNFKGANKGLLKLGNALRTEVIEGRMNPQVAVALIERGFVARDHLTNLNLPFLKRIKAEFSQLQTEYAKQRALDASRVIFKSSVTVPPQAPEILPMGKTAPVETIPDVSHIINDYKTNDFAKAEIQIKASKGTIENPFYKDLVINPAAMDRVMLTGEGKNFIIRSNLDSALKYWEENPTAERSLIATTEAPNRENAFSQNVITYKLQLPDGPALRVGFHPQEANIRDWQNLVSIPKAQARDTSVLPLNEKANDVTFYKQLSDLKINQVRANVIKFGRNEEGIPWVNVQIPQENWGRAIEAKPIAEQLLSERVGPINSRQEIFANPSFHGGQVKIMADGYFQAYEDFVAKKDLQGFQDSLNKLGDEVLDSKAKNKLRIEGVENQTYEDVWLPLKRANDGGRLNEEGKNILSVLENTLVKIKETLGEGAVRKFLALKIGAVQVAETSPVVAPVVSAPAVTTVEQPTPIPVTKAPEIVTLPEVIEKSQNKAVKQPTKFNIWWHQLDVSAERPIVNKDYGTFGGRGPLEGFSKRIDVKILELKKGGATPEDEQVQNLYDLAESLTRENIQDFAKDTLTQKNGYDNWDTFEKHYVEKMKANGIEPFEPSKGKAIVKDQFAHDYDNKQLQIFRNTYNRLSQSSSSTPVLKGKIIDIPSHDPWSPLEKQINNSIEGKLGMKLVGLDTIGKNFNSDFTAGDYVQLLGEEMLRQNIYPLSLQNGDSENAKGLLIPAEARNSLLKYYEEHNLEAEIEMSPIIQELIGNRDRMIRESEMKMFSLINEKHEPGKLNDTEKMLFAFHDKFTGDPSIPADKYIKRSNILDSQAIQYNVPNGDIKPRFVILPATEVSSIVDQIMPPSIKDNPDARAVWAKKLVEDGVTFNLPEDAKEVNNYFGVDPEATTYKAVVSGKLPNRKPYMHKSGDVVLNFSLRQFLEKKFNIVFQRGDKITFATNFKSTDLSKLDTLLENPDIKVLPFDRRNLSFLYKKVKGVDDQSGTWGVLNLAHYSASDVTKIDGKDVFIKPYLVNMFKPAVEKAVQSYNASWEDPAKAHFDLTGSPLEDVAFGRLKRMAAEGAGKFTMFKQSEKNWLSYFRENVMKNKNMGSAFLTSVPDMGYIDPVTNQRVSLTSDKLFLSKEILDKNDNPSHVMTLRYPNQNKLAMSKLETLNAEDHGIEGLGAEAVIDNTFDLQQRKGGDHDGDKLGVFKIISKADSDKDLAAGIQHAGFPDIIAENGEQDRSRYIQQYGHEPNPESIMINGRKVSLTGPDAEYPKLPVWDINSVLYMWKQLADGKEGIGSLTNAQNLAHMIKDNSGSPATIKILTIKAGGVLLPQADFETDNILGSSRQAATDVTSKNVYGQLTAIERNPYSIIFKMPDGSPIRDVKILKEIKKNMRNSYSAFLRLAKANYDSVSPSTDTSGNSKKSLWTDWQLARQLIPTDVSKQHPLQQVFLPLDNLNVLSVSSEITLAADTYASTSLTKPDPITGESLITQPKITEDAQKFLDRYIYQQAQKDNLEQSIKDLRKSEKEVSKLQYDNQKKYRAQEPITDYYYNHVGEYSLATKQAISYFLITDKLPEGTKLPDKETIAKLYNAGPRDPKTKKLLYPISYEQFVARLSGNTWVNKYYPAPKDHDRIFDLILPEHTVPYHKAEKEWIAKNYPGILENQVGAPPQTPPTQQRIVPEAVQMPQTTQPITQPQSAVPSVQLPPNPIRVKTKPQVLTSFSQLKDAMTKKEGQGGPITDFARFQQYKKSSK